MLSEEDEAQRRSSRLPRRNKLLEERQRKKSRRKMGSPATRSAGGGKWYSPTSSSSRVAPMLSSMWPSSASDRQQTVAATMEPAEAPEMTRGRRRWSRSAATTPRWYAPRPAPPDSKRAVLPCAWRHSLKKAKRASVGTEASRRRSTISRHVTAASKYERTTSGPPVRARSYSLGSARPMASLPSRAPPRSAYMAACTPSSNALTSQRLSSR
mmetsp:Transcript_22283/g.68579  ORF Transcript_22283/g.68579 Transcript_22283/m.68579 type:complete len:212 (-) Transcript_22283:479-1114(-)